MKKASPIPTGASRNTRVRQGRRPAFLAAFLTLIMGFSATWVSASRDHPARVSFMDGRAAYESSGDVDWNEVTLNLPLVSGDRIMAHPESRIEVELGDGNFIRISGETDVLFPELSQKKTILKIHRGDLILRVDDAGRVQVELEQASVKIRKKGLYRMQVDPNDSIRLVVHKGRAEVSSRHGKERVETGQELLLDARRIGIQSLVRDLDEFEQWSGGRDAVMVSSRSVGYMGSADFPGIQSLDHHGYWANYGHYDHVWVPDVSKGWAPFRFGRWCYLSSGLTWVSSEPWGWLPYHYGNWIYYRPLGRWAWVPGNFRRWQPAPVDFFSGSGYVGWAPRNYYELDNRRGGHRHNWDPRYHESGVTPNGLTIVHRNDLGRGQARTRVAASGAVVGGFRQGLSRELRRPHVWNRNAGLSRSGVHSSRSVSRSTSGSRERVAEDGSRRSTVARSGSQGSRSRVQARRSGAGRSTAGITPTRTRQSFRSTASNRSFSSLPVKIQGGRNQPHRPQCFQALCLELEEIETRFLVHVLASIRQILIAVRFSHAVSIEAFLQLHSLFGTIDQSFTQSSGTVRAQTTPIIRR